MTLTKRVLRYWLALALPLACWVADEAGSTFLKKLDGGTKTATYTALAASSGALLGFGLTAFTILFAVAPGTRLAAVLALQGRRIRQFLTGALIALASSTLGFGLLIPLDHADRATWWRFVAVALFGVLVTAVGELIWLADRVFSVLSAQVLAEEQRVHGAPPATVSSLPRDYNVPTLQDLPPSTP